MSDEFGGDRVIRHLVGTDRVDPGSGQRSINALPDSPPDGELDEIFSAEVDEPHTGAVGRLVSQTKTMGSRVSSRNATSGDGDDSIETNARSIWPSAIAARCPAEPVRLCRIRTVTSGLARRNSSNAAGRFNVPHDMRVPRVTVPVSFSRKSSTEDRAR
jgi:hypothetical protein